MPPPKPPIDAVAGGVRVCVRVTPKAARAGIAGVGVDAAGRGFLQVRVTAPAEGGRANAALLKLLAREWSVPRARLAIVAGAKHRLKSVRVAGDPSVLLDRLAHLIEERHE